MPTPALPFVLPGFIVEHVHTTDTTLLLEARASTPEAACPDCHTPMTHVHSWYTRRLRDLPIVDSVLRLCLHVRRFRCSIPTCARRTFAERLPALAPCHAQRTVRFTDAIRVLGGEAAFWGRFLSRGCFYPLGRVARHASPQALYG